MSVFSKVKSRFDEHIQSVKELMNFDRFLLDFCILQIEALEERIKNNRVLPVTNPYLLPTNTLTMLRSVRRNDSLRIQYKSIYNQCMVLAVSYYTSVIGSVFKEAINVCVQHKPELIETSNEDIKLSIAELVQYNFDLSQSFGEIIIKKKDISFQDMQSIHRAFKSFFRIDLAKDKDVNNIITAQASRHAIVHSLSIADERFMKQIADAMPRDILQSIHAGNGIAFEPDEIDKVIFSMEIHLDRIIQELNAKIY